MGKEDGLGKVVALSGIAAALSFILLHLLTPMDIATALFISLGLASSVGAIIAMDRGEAVGEVVGFAVLLLLAFISGWFLPSKSAIVFVLPSDQAIIIDTWTLPLIFLGLVVLFGLVKYLGGDMTRFGLWVLTVALTIAYFATSDVTARILIAATQALIVFLPATQEASKTSKLYAVLALPVLTGYDKTITIDLTGINVYAAFLIPVLALVALDPFDKVPKNYRGLAALIVLMIVFLQVVSMVIRF
jgi:hypothetical protein